jgi:2-keto-4-pentenoate hydratase/2-oxohepta-3-ene-1,7-dioic acid hydratase in catechol pathway
MNWGRVQAVLALVVCCFVAPRAAEAKVTKFARFEVNGRVAYGIVEGDRVREVSGNLFGDWRPGDATHALGEVKLLVPVVPTKVLAVGLNYKSHLGDRPAPGMPEMFYKPVSCLVPNGAAIVIPEGTKDVQYEGEMVLVMGKRARNVARADALSYVFGVTCGNDVSARDWQKSDLQWWRAKGADTFGPCGPFVVTGLNFDDLALELRVNGETRQKARTNDLLHSVADIVSSTSRYVTLEPGDLIYTGTPGKTSALKPGDAVEVELEGVGILKNPVSDAPAVAADNRLGPTLALCDGRGNRAIHPARPRSLSDRAIWPGRGMGRRR